MKLSFSNRGWSNMLWDELIAAAVDMNFQGMELHDPQKQNPSGDRSNPLHKYNAAASIRALREKELCIPCIDTSLDLSKELCGEAAVELIEIAGFMRVPYVSLWASENKSENVERALSELIPLAREEGVVILIKTAGVFGDTKKLRSLMDSFACDELGALWDVHHPVRDFSESPSDTIVNLGAYVRHVHMRDSNDRGEYDLMGEGSLPIEEIMDALYSIDYSGFISLEWKPEWRQDIKDREIILPHFVNYMGRFENPSGKRKTLYYNHDGSGRYVWKKDELIDCTFSKVLDRIAEEFPDQYAFRYTTLDYTRTYEEFRNDVDDFACALLSLGVKPGTKVAVWATNVPEWYIAFWASAKIGAVLVTMNTAYKIHEADYLLRQSDTHTLVMIESCLDSNYREIINELCPELALSRAGEPLHCKRLPFLRNVITVGFKARGCLSFREAMERSELFPREEMLRLASKVRPEDVCNMQYTSGTTGFPKGVMLTHYNVVNNGKCIGDRMDLSTADRMMIQVPMFHCFGMVLAMTSAMTHGATVCPLPYFSAKASLACINQERITCFHGVPTMFIAMINHEDYRKTDFSHMRTGIMAGSGCPPELMRRVARPDEMNMRGIVSVYGQTESAPGNTMSAWDDPIDVRCDTVGHAFPHVQCRITDPETGLDVPDGVNGEFCSRGYNTMKGYYKMPEATKAAVDCDGWLHSGDLACRDERGNYRITGRLKDMIIRGGENIYPREIEEFIFTHQAVKDVQVIGVPDKKYGEEIMACIIVKEGQSVTEKEMTDYIAVSMARHKVPRYIEFMEAFPMNGAGKILKYKMRENAIERLHLETPEGMDTGSRGKAEEGKGRE